MKRLYFVRHGQSTLNLSGHFAGATEAPLTTLGRHQAKAAGKMAKTLAIDTIISSPMERALETAGIIANEIGYPKAKIIVNKLFVERDFGGLEGEPWSPDLDLDGISDIETVDTILERASLALEFLHTLKDDNILVVSHGAFGRALRSIIHPNHAFHNRTSNAGDGIPNAEIVCWIE